MNYIIELPVQIAWFFILNPMHDRLEGRSPFGPYPSKQAAIDYYNSQKVEAYQEKGSSPWGGEATWNKCFAKGSEFEWMNPLNPSEFDKLGPYGHGLVENTKVIGPEISRRPL